MEEQEEYLTADFSELDDSFDFNADDFGFETEHNVETRIIKPPKSKDKTAMWKNAQKTAAKIDIVPNMNYFGIIDGSFIFGDLIEAILVGKRLRAERMDIQTLSLSQENVDSLATLLIRNYIGQLTLVVSDYFFSNERNGLIPYIYDKLDIGNRFQLVVAGTHTKIVAADLSNGVKMVMHGSANLRSSGNIEQIAIQDSPEIYEFITEMDDKLTDKFKTINKSVRRQRLWLTVSKQGQQPEKDRR